MKARTELYLRNIIFGMIDSLVSTVGLLSGLASTGAPRQLIITTGIIYALVEGFSMAIGSFLSEESVEEYQNKQKVGLTNSISGATVMFITFAATACIPIAPYFYFNFADALVYSILVSVLALAVVGAIAGKISKVSMFRRGMTMSVLGTFAIVIGVVVGKIVGV